MPNASFMQHMSTSSPSSPETKRKNKSNRKTERKAKESAGEKDAFQHYFGLKSVPSKQQLKSVAFDEKPEEINDKTETYSQDFDEKEAAPIDDDSSASDDKNQPNYWS